MKTKFGVIGERQKGRNMNDHEREGWVTSDETLYSLWRDTNQGISTFVRGNRAMLTKYIQEKGSRNNETIDSNTISREDDLKL
jgi:hypothetical protein